jgi:hypothetical protein
LKRLPCDVIRRIVAYCGLDVMIKDITPEIQKWQPLLNTLLEQKIQVEVASDSESESSSSDFESSSDSELSHASAGDESDEEDGRRQLKAALNRGWGM